MFRIILRGRNVQNLLGKTLKSILAQTCEDWNAYLSLDDPTDRSLSVAMNTQRHFGMKLWITCRDKNIGVAGQMYHVPWSFKEHCKYSYEIPPFSPDDILVFVDADGDRLDGKALRIVEKVYQKHPECLLTYGSYLKRSKGRRTKISHPYPEGANVRKHPWRASHLKTMKWKLFEKIPESAFQHKGKWLCAASDLALMIPAMEMAGLERCRHIHRIIYDWRDNVNKEKRALEKKCESIIRAKKPFEREVW
jgi:glycosyltransferase involved in cell wall biosynthesis